MSDIIQLLPDSVANQIAAGEVIQRPASVIKELVENSVDAGAQTINILVTDAGRTSIQVIDNGKGMSETDARLSFERHATSKIRCAGDLFSLHTMGFRGEALASIAAVAQVELKTRTATDDIGTLLSISASKVTGQEAVACPVGSNFLVQNLFYNVPVRRKFLKSNSTELSNIVTAFERIALVNPQINFTLHSNGSEMFNLRAGGLRQRIIDVLGKRLNQDLLPVSVDTTVCRISGFVGKPESAKKKGTHQFFFVNGRYMKHPYFHKAVMTSYERLIPLGDQISYFIYIDVEPQDIDVNIHPTKTEIKFENEHTIWQILMAAVKEAVGKFSDVPSIDFDTEGRPDIPVFDASNHNVSLPKVDYNPNYNPFNETPKTSYVPENWDTLYGTPEKSEIKEMPLFTTGKEQHPEPFGGSAVSTVEEKSPSHYQYKGKYIMTAVKSGLMIIDQHRAHVRILYDRYIKQIEDKTGNTQKVLFPEMVQLGNKEKLVMPKVMPLMEKLGFELSDLGDGSYAVNGIPAGIEGIDVVSLVRDMVAVVAENGAGASSQISHLLSLPLARRAAIPYGQVLNNGEMENIVNELFACSNVNYTPDGKTILTIYKQAEIERIFG